MFGIEMTGMKKAELGVALAMVLGIGYLTYANWGYWSGKEMDPTITSYVEERPGPLIRSAGARPVEDVKGRTKVTVFANYDGKLRLIEYPNDEARAGKILITFEPDVRRTGYRRWQDRRAQLDKIKDPARRFLTLHAFNLIQRKPSPDGWEYPVPTRPALRSTLTVGEQRSVERAASTALTKEDIPYLDNSMADGTFESDLYAKVLAALEKYRAYEADPVKDPAKAKLANAVVDLAMEYLDKVQSAKLVAINKYVDAVYNTLDKEQRESLGEAAKTYAARPTSAHAARTGAKAG